MIQEDAKRIVGKHDAMIGVRETSRMITHDVRADKKPARRVILPDQIVASKRVCAS